MSKADTTILVIEDEEILRESMADFLEDQDFRVLMAENGRVGLELFERERPDLVLTDLRMPETDGLEVLRRAGELSPETPIIVVSGTGRISDSVQALRLGAWDYIVKPVEDVDIITLAVDKALEQARLRRENITHQENLESLVRERTLELEQANTHLTSINARLKSAVETTRYLSICSNVAQFSSTLLDEFAKHMAASGGSLFLLENDGARLLHTLEPGHVPEFIPFPLLAGSILKRVIEEKKPLLIQDITQEKDLKPSGWDGYASDSAIIFPLLDQTNHVAGVITLHSKTLAPFNEQDKEIGSLLASYSYEVLSTIQAAESLRASEARFRAFADASSMGLGIGDLQGNLVFANPTLARMFGADSPTDILGANVTAYYPEKDRQEVVNTIIPTVIETGGWSGELPLCSIQGDITPTEQNIFLLYDENGEPQFLANIISDITGRLAADEERARLQQQIMDAQQQVIRELSSPIIPIMDRIIVVPLIGSIDTQRARQTTRALLAGIREYRAKVVILDITGVPVIDGEIAEYLDKTIQAARLKGARVIVTGISDAVSEAIVDLGIDWSRIDTQRDLQTGLLTALHTMGIELAKA